jgi:hypothetical protein
MLNALAHIDGWLDAVKADRRRLKAASSCVVVAHQLSKKTNGKEFRKTGRLITWQSIPKLAAATGLSERMVRYAVRRLEAAGHLAIETGRGPRQSNLYTLVEKRHPSAAIAEANCGTPLPHSVGQARHSGAPTEASEFSDCGNRVPPNSSISNSRILPTMANTERSGPRQRADVLGPLDILDTHLRQCLGENAKWLDAARPVELTDGVITLSILTPYQGDNIRKYCEPDILAAAGATELKFIVADPPKARRRS